MPDRIVIPGKRRWLAVAFALVYPTILTLAYFVLPANGAGTGPKILYGAGKALQFGFPLAWCWFILGWRPQIRRPQGKLLAQGLLLGFVMVLPALLVHFLVLKPAGIFAMAIPILQEKIAAFEIATPGRFLMLSLFYSILHSLAEEYYWRWFVFGQLQSLQTHRSAVLISSLGFMAHHVLVLAVYFGWTSPVTYIFSALVAIGGIAWAQLYKVTGSLYPSWICHALVDAGIFYIGYDLLNI
jgi:uncharacterized protein